ncbi:hypothetical protein BPAE_0174g00020 [Botrytis paeoniae]|uniref:Uncharacterized protein n=1 Tax=Botrytis paeoniae TaxID=278948 RepID=A0A4Z1FL77_9HELO|nr:hypothetical protein BPAE_0174g00020 [Botrytis paeoniae]
MSIWHQPGSIPALPVYVGTAGGGVKSRTPVEESVHDEKLKASLITSILPVVVGVGKKSWLSEDSKWNGRHRYGMEGWIIANSVLSAMQGF